MEICEANVRKACTIQHCQKIHCPIPYLWQICLDERRVGLGEKSQEVEFHYCNPGIDEYSLETILQEPDDNGVPQPYAARLDFHFPSMKCRTTLQQINNPSNIFQGIVPANRFSTPSYVDFPNEGSFFSTVWTWYWKNGSSWKIFGKDSKTPKQSVLETKFKHNQEVYRFEAEEKATSVANVFLSFYEMKLYVGSKRWYLQRRPKFVSMDDVNNTKFPETFQKAVIPYTCTFPENWYPIDPELDYELVPLNPDSMDYHLVASEVVRSLRNRKIKDIFRIQNPYLWNKFDSKRQYMKCKGKNLNELQLFHGTSEPTVVKAILSQNFDWRVCGKNATMFGKGVYFAKDAVYSDRYTGPSDSKDTRWMFMARVIVGKYTLGNKEYTRPPPIDPSKPHGELYDSCVNEIKKPTIYVLFDSDQYYPEYVIGYEIKDNVF